MRSAHDTHLRNQKKEIIAAQDQSEGNTGGASWPSIYGVSDGKYWPGKTHLVLWTWPKV